MNIMIVKLRLKCELL